MSFAESVSPPSQAGRRSHARCRLDGLAYVEFGSDNGAILIDLGEGGLGFQSVLPVILNQALVFKFKLPAQSSYIEGYGEVAWMNQSGKGGGLRFVELNTDACAQIRLWSGMLLSPETAPSRAGNGAESNGAQESASEEAAANSIPESSTPETESPAPETVNGDDAAEPILVALTAAEDVQAAVAGPESDQAADAVEAGAADEQIAADQVALPLALPLALPQASPIPEFTMELAAASDSAAPLAGTVEWAPRADAVIATSAAGAHPFEPTPQDRSTQHVSQVAKTTAAPETAPAAPANLAKTARPPVSDANFASAQKRQRKPAPVKPESSLPPVHRQESAAPGAFVRQTPKPAPASTEWEHPLAGPAGELKPQPSFASQALKTGLGVAAGVCLVLALVIAVPSLRTRVQATANARSGAFNVAGSPAFQIEVADLSNRRWILKSGGDAASPFSETPARRETQPGASTQSGSAKTSRPEDSDESSAEAKTPQPKLPKPGELALSRPHAIQAQGASAELLSPSIFDGITPPIGSVTERLVEGSPEAPRIVQPETQPSIRASALQSAVLVQRVAPIYPSDALESRLQGNVLVNATIGTNGVPKNLKVVKGDQRLVPAALTAIRQWRYRPATLAGQPIETQTDVTVSFQLK